MTGRLAGKKAFITGGAGCIGSVIVHRFVQEGADVIFVDIEDDKGLQLQTDILKEFPNSHCQYKHCDVSKEQEIEQVLTECYQQDGKLDIVVNNAAVFLFGTVEEISEETWDKVFAVNVKGYAFTAKHAHKYLKATKGANIVNMASISSFVAQPSFVPYNTSKGAVLQMTRCMAMDMSADGIRVNAVCPGVVDTEAVTNHANSLGRDRTEVAQELASLHVIPRLAKPLEVANATLFLASDEASFVTGHPLMVDGGWSVR